MEIGIIGLGKMGLNLALNLIDHNHKVVGYDSHAAVEEVGFTQVSSIETMIKELKAPRTLWLMVPAGEITESVIQELTPLLEEGDSIIDGGNSNYKDTVRRAANLKEHGIFFFDCGTSGGTDGARHGICSMIGGDAEKFKTIESLLKDISVEDGYLYTGEAGSGHFLKMIHNGIEYGMMQSIAEGFDILNKSPFGYDFEKVADVWNNGSIISSYLMEMTKNAFSKDAKLEGIKSGTVAQPAQAVSLVLRGDIALHRRRVCSNFTG